MRSLSIFFLSTVSLPASGFVARSGQSTWVDYKHDYVDDLAKGTPGATTPQQGQDSAAATAKAAKAKAFWETKVQEDKEKLHHMKSQEVVGWYSHPTSPRESWGHYKDALYALVPHRRHQSDSFHWPKHPSVKNWSEYKHDYVDGLARPPPDMAKVEEEKRKDAKRAKADAFWESKYKEDKERLSHMKGEEKHPDVHTETWDHYKHDYIDAIPRHKSVDAELEELRQQAAAFKALALAESVGHTLAEEALHEAQERAVSCEIAEAVLLGAATGDDRKPSSGEGEKHEGGGFHLHV